jgi:hypothetical protein
MAELRFSGTATSVGLLLACLFYTASAGAATNAATAPDETEGESPATGTGRRPMADEVKPERASRMLDIRGRIPQLTYAYSAYGAELHSVGAQAFGLALVASGMDATLGGGAAVWGSPLKRLTLMADARRNVFGNFSPSAALLFRILGEATGWSLGALGKFKVEGFAGGPDKDEVEGEVELGFLTSFNGARWHLDLNAIGGRGTGEEGEMDVEGRLRLGRDLGRFVRLGVDGQLRARVAGPRVLPNGRSWDFVGGPQLLVGSDSFYAALTAGPSTMGVTSSAVGVESFLCMGGAR